MAQFAHKGPCEGAGAAIAHGVGRLLDALALLHELLGGLDAPLAQVVRWGVAQHGFESVTTGLMEHYDYFHDVMARHDIQLTRTRVEAELRQIQQGGYNAAAMFVLPPATETNASGSADTLLTTLERNLQRLSKLLDDH